MSGTATPRGRSFAEKLDHLFAVAHPRGRRPYSVDEVANAIAGQGGAPLSANYIWMLRKGLRDNPTVRAVESLARFFDVPTAYFFDSDVEVRANYQLHVAAQVIEIAMEAMAKIIDVAGRTEPPGSTGPGQEP